MRDRVGGDMCGQTYLCVELWMKRQPCTGFSREWIEQWMELHAMIDGLSHINDLFFFLFYLLHDLLFLFYLLHQS